MKKHGERIRQALTQPGSGEVPERFLSPEGICQLLSISSRTLRRWVRAGVFPPPIRVGPYKATPRWSPLLLTDFLLSKHPPRQAEELATKRCGDDSPARRAPVRRLPLPALCRAASSCPRCRCRKGCGSVSNQRIRPWRG
jgi:predicted DNA-binding transcriptional regulator AlpA